MRIGYTLAGILLGVALAGCAARDELAGQEAGCKVRRDAQVALRRVRDFLLLPAKLDGHAVQMVLDTGAEVSTISPAVAAGLDLPLDTGQERVLRGVGGDVRTQSVLVTSFVLGDLPPQPARLSIGLGDLLPGEIPPVAGLLGADLVGGRDLDLDAPAGRAVFYTVQECPGFRPWPGNTGLALARTPTGLDFAVADLDGRAVRVLLDTGARTSFMTRRLAASLGVTDDMLAADPSTIKVGISRAEIDVRQHRFDQISLGPVTWRDVPVGIADVSLPGVDMLLGADLLGRQRIWISPSRAMLWLR